MAGKFLPPVLLLAALALVAPQTALADDNPSLVRVADLHGRWTVTKLTSADDGKFKIYSEIPKQGSPSKEMKAEGETYSLVPGRDYWFVFFPHNTRVAVQLAFLKTGVDSKSTLSVQGTYHSGYWWQGVKHAGPTLNFLGHADLITYNQGNFGKGDGGGGKPGSPLITLLNIEPAKPAAPPKLSAEEKALRDWEMSKRTDKTPDPLGNAPDDDTRPGLKATARDYWRLELDPSKKPTKEELAKAFRKMSLVFHPDRYKNSPDPKDQANADLVYKKVENSRRRISNFIEGN